MSPLDTWARRPESGFRVTWLGHSTLLLELLHALTEADSQATGPAAWVGAQAAAGPALTKILPNLLFRRLRGPVEAVRHGDDDLEGFASWAEGMIAAE